VGQAHGAGGVQVSALTWLDMWYLQRPDGSLEGTGRTNTDLRGAFGFHTIRAATQYADLVGTNAVLMQGRDVALRAVCDLEATRW
jgi:hypothetical protein